MNNCFSTQKTQEQQGANKQLNELKKATQDQKGKRQKSWTFWIGSVRQEQKKKAWRENPRNLGCSLKKKSNIWIFSIPKEEELQVVGIKKTTQ